MNVRFLSVCSGIEAASVAWNPLGWKAAAFSEIEPFPCAVLAHHYPSVPNRGDMTKFQDWPDESIDILCGGTPCQSFSVAGLRKGLADPRGNLMLVYGAIAAKYRPRWLVWENVPGVLSSNEGRDFGAFLGMLGQLGYGFAYRVLDAKYFGIPQQRRRVFVVGHLGSWQRAAAVLFERASLSGVSPAPRSDSVADVEWWAGEGRVLNCIDASYGAKWGSNQWYARGHVIIDRTGRQRLAKQGGVCALCSGPMERPVVDHCHQTNQVRGILCHHCNIKLPVVEDMGWVMLAWAYLEGGE